jgi:UDPglucose 6-dehydrogenase
VGNRKLQTFGGNLIMRISIIGTGKLGSSMAAVYATAGHQVVCVDQNKELIEKFNKGECPIVETDLEKEIAIGRKNMVFTSDYLKIKDTEISFVIVPTPSKKDGAFTNEYVLSAIKNICEVVRDNKSHLIVIVSTVMPGSCTDVFIPEIEKIVGKKINDNIFLCYNPEFIALGEVIKGMRYPDTLLIGESCKQAGDMLEWFHRKTLNPIPPIHRMSLWNAELSKISLNCYITMKISYANMIAELCEKIPTGNAYDVLASVGEDKRVGKKYLNPGLGYSGPCFPRDVKAFLNVTGKFNSISMLASATDCINDRHNDRYAEKAKRILGSGKHKVAILGVTYKPNTPNIEQSAALSIIKELSLSPDISISLYDPMANYQGIAKQVKTIEEALNGADLCIIATPWLEFHNIPKDKFTSLMAKPNILDCWNICDIIEDEEIKVNKLGVSDIGFSK